MKDHTRNTYLGVLEISASPEPIHKWQVHPEACSGPKGPECRETAPLATTRCRALGAFALRPPFLQLPPPCTSSPGGRTWASAAVSRIPTDRINIRILGGFLVSPDIDVDFFGPLVRKALLDSSASSFQTRQPHVAAPAAAHAKAWSNSLPEAQQPYNLGDLDSTKSLYD